MKAVYFEKPIWSATTKEDIIELQKDWLFVVDNIEYWIPAGYKCDAASIPAPFWIVPGIGTPTSGFNAIGAFAHDALYLTHALTRSQTDEVAYQLWIQAGKPRWAARTMWAAVRSPAGAWAWRNTWKDLEDLAAVRKIINFREDKSKFQSLWFTGRTLPLSA